MHKRLLSKKQKQIILKILEGLFLVQSSIENKEVSDVTANTFQTVTFLLQNLVNISHDDMRKLVEKSFHNIMKLQENLKINEDCTQ